MSDDATTRNTTPPPWLEDAVHDTVDAAITAHMMADPDAGADLLSKAFLAFGELVESKAAADWPFAHLTIRASQVAAGAQRAIDTVGDLSMSYLKLADRYAGEPLADMEATIDTGQVEGEAMLTAIRLVVAAVDGDQLSFTEVFRAGMRQGVSAMALLYLLDIAGASYVAMLHAENRIPEEFQKSFAARCALIEAVQTIDDAYGPDVEKVFVTATPSDVERIDEVAPYGDGIYIVFPVHSDPHTWHEAVAGAHKVIANGLAGRGEDPDQWCGILHHETIDWDQVPEKSREPLERDIERLQRHTGEQWDIMRCWQHPGHCSEADT